MTTIIATMLKRRGLARGTLIDYKTYGASRRFMPAIAVLIVFGFVLMLVVGVYMGESKQKRDMVRVVSVSDGDTIRVQNGKGSEITVRLVGIDTPETHHPTKPIQCFGPEAENFTRENLTGKTVSLEYDVERYDRYGRTLAYVYVDNTRFNDVLVEQGYARTLSIEPNTKYARRLARLELDARNKSVGLWGYCSGDL